ncbi:putative cruciform DNA binding protein [Basidiobolus meristosporus CBS 931.73]|uniref:Putative cruciform DNA binding protein n=1 Tax=Basidiobolus meristosporus CBS 931.73 TaxID=1314790 RepID=A0A1Y1YC10_9FUNG|nr:putative cruciform DNA binding protein [Basidiobolus meristosporus CBS 931.73]|eukprot:ORX95518.1 putative cruciform DNA binding protein [Basidiobolus meristosporus CBS 931.73]
MDKITANMKSAAGAVQENVGSAIGNQKIQAEGAATRAEGNAEYLRAQAQGYAQGAGEKLEGHFQENVGSALGNLQTEVEGAANKAKGEARMQANSGN